MKMKWLCSNHSANFEEHSGGLEKFYTSGSAIAIYKSSQLSSQVTQLTALSAFLHFQLLQTIG